MMSSGVTGTTAHQQSAQTSTQASLNFGSLPPVLMGGALGQHQQQSPAFDMQQLMLASLDPTLANNPLRALYLSQLAALSGQCSQGSSDNSPSSSSTTVTSSATNTAPTCPLSPMGEQQTAASSIAEVTQAALNAISMASLSGAAANNPSSTPGAASQNGEPATSSSAGSDMPNWLAGLMPQAAVAASAANSMQTAQNSITPPNPSVPSLLEQMQLMGAAQMMSGGGATASASNPLGGQPLNALAAALSQAPASTTAPPLTPNSAAALLAATGNYGSPAKDAYCELCDKNFCNRYFLKTHRQKKHGITDDSCSPMKSFPASPGAQLAGLPFQPSSQLGALVPPATSLALGTAAIAAMQLPANLAALMAACGTAVPSSSAGPHSAPAATPPSQLSSASLNQSTSVIVNGSSTGSPNAKLIKLETNEQDSAGVAEDIDDDGSEGKPKSPTENLLSAQISASPAGELPSTCDLCNKSFPTLFSLLAHKAREHMPLGSANLTSAENTMQAQRSPVKSAQSPGDDEKIACEMCEKEFESRHYLQQHILIHHSGIANASSLLGSFLPAGLPLPFMLPPTLPQNFQMSDNEQANLLAGINAQINTPQPKQAVKRQYSSSGKNYCDLCNKEVCNKYFLRTHMLKMHGIVIDENKTVIANIDTLEKEKMGAISFRCDICMAELKSRHLLRSHKQEAHGVVPIHTPPTGGQSRTPKHSSTSTPNVFSTTQTPVINGQLADKGSERCDICMAELKSRHLLRSHKQEAHGVVPIHTPPTGGQSRTPKHSSTSTPNVFSTTQTPVINGQLADKGSESVVAFFGAVAALFCDGLNAPQSIGAAPAVKSGAASSRHAYRRSCMLVGPARLHLTFAAYCCCIFLVKDDDATTAPFDKNRLNPSYAASARSSSPTDMDG
ncbi:hypothetical protein Tcan_15243 [Toxocara canis]|uniref:C2H2-type domain-containing protein n=1 Tax=Toxocara canis TaxID=6265 RepID=A0A0B2VE32_TOXCA|nr:hypothetical protein Tcan_15243 [Toxocara canis]